jgi:hypothetical protein
MLPEGMKENTHPLQPALPGKPHDPNEGVHQGIGSVAQLKH